MDDQIQTTLSEVLNFTKDNLFQAAEVIKQQFPELCNQILSLVIAKSIFNFCLFGGILLTFIFCLQKYIKTDKGVYVPIVLFSGIGTLLSLITSIYSMINLITVKVAPHVYLLKYFKNLI